MALGRSILEYLKASIKVLTDMKGLHDDKQNYDLFNQVKVRFEEEKDVQPPEVKVLQNMDDLKSAFRQANTQYKKSLEYFVLDGYVTEHIQIKEDISELYKALCKFE